MPPADPAMNIEPSRQFRKSDLRKRIRQERALLAPAQRQTWDSKVNNHLLNYVGQTQPRVVAGFLAFDGEPDLAPALDQMEHQGVRLAVPVIRTAHTRSDMCFRQWSQGAEVRPNRYGIPEPVGTPDIPLREIDLALIPLVAWDAQGGRLGMGAGFYDRFFQTLANQRLPYRLGVAYQLQQVKLLPLDPWDIRLHGILTENGCFSCPF